MKFITTNLFYNDDKLVPVGSEIEATGSYAAWLIRANVAKKVGDSDAKAKAENTTDNGGDKPKRSKGTTKD